MAEQQSNKQTIATISAIILGLAGAAGWLKPPDTTATEKTYDATKSAIEALEKRQDDDFDECMGEVDRLVKRQREFEDWAVTAIRTAAAAAGNQRSQPVRVELAPPPEPPPKPSAAPRPPTAQQKLPDAKDLLD